MFSPTKHTTCHNWPKCFHQVSSVSDIRFVKVDRRIEIPRYQLKLVTYPGLVTGLEDDEYTTLIRRTLESALGMPTIFGGPEYIASAFNPASSGAPFLVRSYGGVAARDEYKSGH